MANMRRASAVGCRVQVYWEGEDEWFDGVVSEFSPGRGYYVKYDDGEEQWEVGVCHPAITNTGEHAMRFLSEPEGGEEVEGATDPMPSPRERKEASPDTEPNDDDEDYDGDHESDEDEQDEEADATLSESGSPTPEQEEQEVSALTPTPKSSATSDRVSSSTKQRALKPAASYMRNSSAFFRDEETLREMRLDLRKEKKALANQVHVLTMQVAEREQRSSVLKRELQQLKTEVTLANVMLQHPLPRGSSEKLQKPKTTTQWNERVLDQKLQNQSLAQELLDLKTSVQEQQSVVRRKQQQRDELQSKLARVPRRHLCTLVELQVEIARLLEEKRTLEALPLPPSSCDSTERPTSSRTGSSSKAALQNELIGLESTAESFKEELRQWQLKVDCEQARLTPMETRLASLQQELRRYEDSQVLLRSVFLRLSPDPHDGCVTLDAALTALHTLAPPDQADATVGDMKSRLKEEQFLSPDDTAEQQQRFSFSQFVEAFTFLFK
ncbi:hypothetical protein BBJ28_00020062 [Nothophytophthora sp. Chile5]|nr:hypothetical protein BBJ28_00020062 [Nothophytophthora sp. Chile5]